MMPYSCSHQSHSRWNGKFAGWGLLLFCLMVIGPTLVYAEEEEAPKTPRMVCGECEEGYATTGTTSAPHICKDGDPTLVQCVPLGSSRLAVCGDCPDGYTNVGSSNVPSQCGDSDGGRLSQCQLR